MPIQKKKKKQKQKKKKQKKQKKEKEPEQNGLRPGTFTHPPFLRCGIMFMREILR